MKIRTAAEVLDRFESEMLADEDLRDVVNMARPIRVMYDPNTLVATLDHLLAAYARARGAIVTIPPAQEALPR